MPSLEDIAQQRRAREASTHKDYDPLPTPMPNWLNDALGFGTNQMLATGALAGFRPTEATQRMMAPYTRLATGVAENPATDFAWVGLPTAAGQRVGSWELEQFNAMAAKLLEHMDKAHMKGDVFTNLRNLLSGFITEAKAAEAPARDQQPGARPTPGTGRVKFDREPPVPGKTRQELFDYLHGDRPQVPMSR